MITSDIINLCLMFKSLRILISIFIEKMSRVACTVKFASCVYFRYYTFGPQTTLFWCSETLPWYYTFDHFPSRQVCSLNFIGVFFESHISPSNFSEYVPLWIVSFYLFILCVYVCVCSQSNLGTAL